MFSVCFFDMVVMIVMVVIVMVSMMIAVMTILMVIIVSVSCCGAEPTFSDRKCTSRLKQTSLYNHF